MTDMSDPDLSAARAQFQDARLALYMARLLFEIENRRQDGGDVGELVSELERANGYHAPVPLVNQTTLLQMAYMTLVFPKQGVIGEVVKDWEPRLCWSRVEVVEDCCENPRFGEGPNWIGLLRTVRNSLAHSSIEVEEQRFVFTDRHRGRAYRVAFDWDFLGELTMEFFHSANARLYPESSGSGGNDGR